MNVQLEDNSGKREAVLNSTLALIKEHGFHGTPMSMIAKHAGVAAGTIYHYFDSKDTLIVELYIHVKERLAGAMLGNDNKDLPYKDRFFNFMINQYNFYIEHPDVFFFLEQYVNSPFAKNYPEKDSQLFKDKVHTFFNYGIENAYFRNIDPRLLAPTVKGTLVAAANFQLSQYSAFSKEDLIEIINIVWDGIKRQ
ncbi:TetR/AcrR family transcriptional regulator [Pedobacter sp. MC2016-15]|uniref:TetR/AcrR family transcriptional regulator n=1 Tax=Pedobacter sp. MC2016-15 TaxID=2994473 RepID=UPI002245BFD8|nr:TetR/AcrR family transcriptional regulator [Pedobacter sp. MC2016-15]MCX2479615.1 TetR/AcrR family transcriptional regulator [Pedobacter sp. MC2016-15]